MCIQLEIPSFKFWLGEFLFDGSKEELGEKLCFLKLVDPTNAWESELCDSDHTNS